MISTVKGGIPFFEVFENISYSVVMKCVETSPSSGHVSTYLQVDLQTVNAKLQLSTKTIPEGEK